MKLRGIAASGILAVAGSGSAYGVTIVDNADTFANVTSGLVALDISSVVSGLTTTNSLVTNFTSPTTAYSGTLTATIYGNVANPGPGLTSVVIIYNFVGNGPSAIDTFQFGLNTGSNLDYNDIVNATHGTVTDQNNLSGTGAPPLVTLEDNSGSGSNDTLTFDFATGGDTIGGGESFSWYVETDGSVAVGRVDGVVTNFGESFIETLGFVNDPNQPDLDTIPLPQGVALGLAGLAGVVVRRRRAM